MSRPPRSISRCWARERNDPAPVVDIRAPISGVIVEQNVTNAAGVKTLDNSPNLFTIADLSSVWILCDVYENDLASVHLGEFADMRLNAYPDKLLKGRISNIGPILDPNTRTAKVRLDSGESGDDAAGHVCHRHFPRAEAQRRAVVPASAVLHLHDRDWVYVPAGGNNFRRVEVIGGEMLPDNMQEIVSGIEPGQPRGVRTRWFCRAPWSSNAGRCSHDPQLVEFAPEQPVSRGDTALDNCLLLCGGIISFGMISLHNLPRSVSGRRQ